MKESLDVSIFKAGSKISINVTLLGISFVLLSFIITMNPNLFSSNFLLSVQLILSIPLLLTSSFIKIKLIENSKKNIIWKRIVFITFTLAYAMILNVMGIFLGLFANLSLSLIFFSANIFMALIYSFVEILEGDEGFLSKFYKDSFFILIIILGGVLPVLNVY